MKRFSIIINWDDRDSEQGTFGWCGLANDEAEAEAKARAEMRATYVENMGGDEEAEQMAEEKQDGDDEFGGSVVDFSRGAIWQAQELEDALRGLLKAADETAARCGWSDHGEREAAHKLLSRLDAEG